MAWAEAVLFVKRAEVLRSFYKLHVTNDYLRSCMRKLVHP